jgi:predicted SAM-dependent methyltransferase
VSTLRSTIRAKVPFSTAIYEDVDRRRRMAQSRRQLPALAARSPLKVDLGGGYRKGSNGWVTIDVSHECDLYWDLRYGIPFADGSVDALYSSHLFEHLPYEDGQKLLRESIRVLKPGGTFSIVVPNARLYVEHYIGDRDLPEEFFGWAPAYNRTTRIDALNYVAYMAGEHKYLFDQENLLHILTAAGFERVAPREFDPETDLAERDYESLYAIGFKPS